MNKLTGVFNGLFVILAVILSMGATMVSAQAPPVVPVTDIDSFVDCLNTIKRSNGSISDAVRCVPDGCYFTATMSTLSAQPACTSGDCKLPRVIFNCTSPDTGLQFEPSFTLCATTNHFTHTELGNEVTAGGALEMGDVGFPRGVKFAEITVDNVLSTRTNDKFCTGCHGPANPPTLGDALLSKPLPPISAFVIDTNMPGQTIGHPDGRTTLTEVCSCIGDSETLQLTPNVDYQALIRLCELLKAKTLRK